MHLLASHRGSELVPVLPLTQSGERADAGIDQFTFTQSRSGKVQWQVKAQRARLFEADHRAVLEHVQVTLYGPRGLEFHVEGDEGTVDTATKNFVLSKQTGAMTVHLENGYTIVTNRLAWTDARREVATAEPVTLTGNGVVITGRGLLGKLDSEEFQILNDVHVEILE
jgi:lipopolysaccharide export system protein LptC